MSNHGKLIRYREMAKKLLIDAITNNIESMRGVPKPTIPCAFILRINADPLSSDKKTSVAFIGPLKSSTKQEKDEMTKIIPNFSGMRECMDTLVSNVILIYVIEIEDEIHRGVCGVKA